MDQDIRMTLALKPSMHQVITDLADHLDVDQGKAIRWIIKTIIEIEPLATSPECRGKLNPQAIYLFDTLSSIKDN